MKRLTTTFLSTMMIALLSSAAATAMAQDFKDGADRPGQRHHRGMPGLPVVDQMMHALKQLNLDETQKSSIRAIMEGMKTDIHPVMQEMKTGHEQLKDLIKADSYDENAVAKLAEKEGQLAAKRMKISSLALSKVYGQLTAEQRSELDNMAVQRKHRRGEKRRHTR